MTKKKPLNLSTLPTAKQHVSFRKDKGADFKVEEAHIARLHVLEGGMIFFDHTYHKKLVLQLKADVKAENLNITWVL